MPIVRHTKGIAESIFLADSSVSEAIRLMVLYVFRTIATPVFSGHFVTPQEPGCIPRIHPELIWKEEHYDENWHINRRGRLSWTERGDPRGRAQRHFSLSR